MKIEMRLGLRDVPGSLLGVLEPIGSHSGNILSVVHSREKNLVDVRIVFRVKDQKSLNLIRKSFRGQRIRVAEIKVEGHQYYSKETVSFILVGHVIDTDVQGTIDRVNEIGMVSDLDVVMPDPEKKSSVIMNVDVDKNKLEKLVSVVEKICAEKDFVLIKSIK